MDPVIGAILAGGRSRRMGADKALVEVGGRPMAEWVAAALSPVCHQVVIAGRPDGLAGLAGIADPGGEHLGPLSGLVGVLRRFPGTPVALVAVDQPWVRTETVRRLGELVTDLAAVPVEGGVRQSTCAVYPPGILEPAETELEGGGSLQSLLDVAAFTPAVDWQSWGEDGRSWFSADTPETIEEGLSRFGTPHP